MTYPSLFLCDPKLEIAPMVAPAWQALGIEAKFANPTGQFPELCPHTNFNLLEAPIDCYWGSDASQYKNTTTFLRSHISISNPPPPPGATNEWFINGGRGCAFTINLEQIISQPELATLSQTHRIASDPEHAMEVICKAAERPESDTDMVSNDVRRAARSVLAAIEGRNAHHFGDFLKHVTDPLAAFSESGWLGDHGEFATARISDLRKRQIALACMTPLSHLTDYTIYNSLFTNALFMACKMHPTGLPVHAILDEFTVAMRLPDLHKEMITLRGLGCSAEKYIQSKSGVADSLGDKPAKVIYGQSDIKQYTALDIDEAQELAVVLGSELVKEFDANVEDRFDQVRFSVKDTDVPLRSIQALLSMPIDEQIIKVRSMRPIRSKKIPSWDVAGLRELVGENPLEGPAPVTEAKAELNISRDGVKVVWPRVPTRFASLEPKGPKKQRLVRFTSFLWLYAWLGLFLVFDDGFDVSWPALRVQYTFSGSFASPSFESCHYFSLNGSSFTKWGGDCPLIMIGG